MKPEIILLDCKGFPTGYVARACAASPRYSLTLAPTGVRATLVPTGGADNRPPEISKTKQARDKR